MRGKAARARRKKLQEGKMEEMWVSELREHAASEAEQRALLEANFVTRTIRPRLVQRGRLGSPAAEQEEEAGEGEGADSLRLQLRRRVRKALSLEAARRRAEGPAADAADPAILEGSAPWNARQAHLVRPAPRQACDTRGASSRRAVPRRCGASDAQPAGPTRRCEPAQATAAWQRECWRAATRPLPPRRACFGTRAGRGSGSTYRGGLRSRRRWRSRRRLTRRE